jgi:hypothetical protein
MFVIVISRFEHRDGVISLRSIYVHSMTVIPTSSPSPLPRYGSSDSNFKFLTIVLALPADHQVLDMIDLYIISILDTRPSLIGSTRNFNSYAKSSHLCPSNT